MTSANSTTRSLGSRAIVRRVLLSCATAAFGAAGMGLETLALGCAGLALGYGRALAFGLLTWIACWSLGAYWAGRSRLAPRVAILRFGATAAVLAAGLIPALLWIGGAAIDARLALVLGVTAIGLAAVPQGAALPLVIRAWDPARGGAREVFWLIACGLAGAAGGAAWIGAELPAHFGRPGAGTCASALTLLATGVAWLAIVCDESKLARPAVPAAGMGAAKLRVAGAWIAFATAWAVGLEWIGLRLGVLWLGGMQPALRTVLVAALVGWTLGAFCLPRLLPRRRGALSVLLVLGLLATVWPFVAPELLTAASARTDPMRTAAILIIPMMFPFGAWIACVHRLRVGDGDSAALLGRLLLHEAWGAPVGILFLQWLVVPRFGLHGALLFLFGAGVLALVWMTRRRPATLTIAVLACTAVGVWGARQVPPALRAPQLANPAFERLAFEEDAHFAVTVVNDGVRGERVLLTDDFRATGTGDDYLYMQALGHLPLLLHHAPARVAVLAFGTGTTAGAVAMHQEVARLDVLELSRAVIRQAHFFSDVNRDVLAEGLPGLLDAGDEAGRVVVQLGDGRRSLGSTPATFDVITMEPLLPDSPFAVYLYTREFYTRARRALRPGGLLCQWVPPHALRPAVFDSVLSAFHTSFDWSAVFLFGSQVLLVGGELRPALDPARFASANADVELAAALKHLGLATAGGLAARFICEGATWPVAPRPLTDGDPWVIYAARPHGREILSLLPVNLARLRAHETAWPSAWNAALGAAARTRLQAVRLLHRAREEWEGRRARRQGAVFADSELASVEDYLTELTRLVPNDAEVQLFERMRRFHSQREAGVASLGQGAARAALAPLLEAAQLRPERADVHLFVATAARRLGETQLAQRAFERALELCPRILETPQGGVAVRLGFLPEL